ncbi:MAG: hypothetical protein QOE40_366 [Actinomycetota bacterium]|jgi:hypothetical protein|nr:hypothetical protein [Actinomycetota bacterium]
MGVATVDVERQSRRRGITGPSARQDRARRVLVKVELGTGGSAFLCGGLLALRPDGSLLGLPTRVLVGAPFSDWRLPGLLLGGLVGVGYLGAGMWANARYPYSRELSVLAGVGLVVFEAVEWGWLGFHPLQAVFMAVGAGVVRLAVVAGNPTTPGVFLAGTQGD